MKKDNGRGFIVLVIVALIITMFSVFTLTKGFSKITGMVAGSGEGISDYVILYVLFALAMLTAGMVLLADHLTRKKK